MSSARIVVQTDAPFQAPLASLLSWAERNPKVVLEIQTGRMTYSLPLRELTSQAWLAKLGADADRATLSIRVAEVGTQLSDRAERGAISEVAAASLLTGYEKQAFRPAASASRAEAAVVLQRLLTNAGMFGF